MRYFVAQDERRMARKAPALFEDAPRRLPLWPDALMSR
jgi:hypothetical protein